MRRGTLKYRLQENHRISNGPHTENRLVERSTQVNQTLDEHSYISQRDIALLMKNIGMKACKSYFFGDRSLRRTVHSNDLVECFWVAMYSKKETGNL